MILDEDVIKYIDKSVLCWLATTDIDGQPNVTPKEIFTYSDKESIIIAHIASPGSVRNIRNNNKVALSFIDILIQKGYQVKGVATIVERNEDQFEHLCQKLMAMAGERFPIVSIIHIHVNKVVPIVAPSYALYPTTKEEDQVRSAKKNYGIG